jgi:isopentenyl-diphosphate delta-isomerase
LAGAFADWGIPTAESLVRRATVRAEWGADDVHLFASGGIRSGQDIAKCVALGADLVGLAGPFLKKAVQGEEDVAEEMEILEARNCALPCFAAARRRWRRCACRVW